MRFLRNKPFGKILFFYAVVSALLMSFVLLAFLFFMKASFSEKVADRYLDIRGISFSEGIAVISSDHFQKHLLSGEQFEELLLRTVCGPFAFATAAEMLLIGLLYAGLWEVHQKVVKDPLDALASYLEKWEKPGEADILEQQHFQRLKQAFVGFEQRTGRVYADFRYLGAYVSHEYKNAMALLRAKIQNENTKNLLPLIDTLVKDMDDILTLCTHRWEDNPKKISLALACGRAVDEFSESGSSIRFFFDEERDICVLGNELWIYRAVCNLLDNAVKYGDGKEVDVVVGSRHECPFLEVWDHGEGILREDRERIFEDGYRIAARKKDGYGIGLSLVKHVAQLSDACLWVKSEKGRGTCFRMVFPPAE